MIAVEYEQSKQNWVDYEKRKRKLKHHQKNSEQFEQVKRSIIKEYKSEESPVRQDMN